MSKAELVPNQIQKRSSLRVQIFQLLEEIPVVSKTPTVFKVKKTLPRESPELNKKSRLFPSLKIECSKVKNSSSPDPYVQKFEKISNRLEKLLHEVHSKYNFARSTTWKSASPVYMKQAENLESFESSRMALMKKLRLNTFEVDAEVIENNNLSKKSLNKHAIRSKIFEGTSRWLSESPR